MRIRFINTGTSLSLAETTEETDVIVFPFYEDTVSYERELKGETSFFEQVARLSKTAGSVVVCGCLTDTKGHQRKSAAVAENGKLLGVSDMLHAVDGACASGAGLRVYETHVGRMGVIVAEDLHFPEIIQSLSVCGSDFLVCPFSKTESIQTALLRAHAYCYGVPIYFCSQGYCMIADVTGEIVFASPQEQVGITFCPKKQYHLVETRRRGVYKMQ